MPKAVIFFAPGLEECEGLITVDLLRRAGVEVTVAAVGGGREILSSHQARIVTDALAEEVADGVFDAVILPGGLAGVANLKADATVRRVCCRQAEQGRLVAAICAAPTVLAEFGLLQGRRATVYPGQEPALRQGGAQYVPEQVVVDGALITGEALGAAVPFALALITALVSPEAAQKVRDAIVWRA